MKSSSDLKLRRKNMINSFQESCIICYESPQTIRFLPCNHAEFCRECVITLIKTAASNRQYTGCPLCRTKVENICKKFTLIHPIKPIIAHKRRRPSKKEFQAPLYLKKVNLDPSFFITKQFKVSVYYLLTDLRPEAYLKSVFQK